MLHEINVIIVMNVINALNALNDLITILKALFGAEKVDIGIENTYFWDISTE